MELGQEGWLKQLVARLEDLSWLVIRDHVGVTTVARQY